MTESDRFRRVVSGYTRARSLVYATIFLTFALLFTFVTARFAIGGGWFETLLLAGLTGGLWWQTVRRFRRYHATGGNVSAPRGH